MTRSEFIALLNKATTAAMGFARTCVDNELPETVRFHVYLNQSFDGHATAEERVYPEDDGRELDCVSEEEVANAIFRDGRCPGWIDISVAAQSATHTQVDLVCCGRYTDNPRLMYYTARGMGPFGIKSPMMPVGFKEGTRFRLPLVLSCERQRGASGVCSAGGVRGEAR